GGQKWLDPPPGRIGQLMSSHHDTPSNPVPRSPSAEHRDSPDRPWADVPVGPYRVCNPPHPRTGGERPRARTRLAARKTLASLIAARCDELFPPSRPAFRVRNQLCHRIYGTSHRPRRSQRSIPRCTALAEG